MISKILRRLFGDRFVAHPRIVPLPGVLSPDEHREISEWLDLPLTRKVFALAEAKRPTLFFAGSGTSVSSQFDEQRVSNRLHQLQGWEWHTLAIHSLRHPPKNPEPLEESYPE